MREIGLITANYTLFIAAAVALTSAQSSLWLHVFGDAPAPYLWVVVAVFWLLTRKLAESIIMIYITTFIFITLSGIPLNLAFLINICVFSFVFALKDRVLWSGNYSFMLACGVSAAAWPVFATALSFIFEERFINNFLFFEWFIQSLLTAIFAIPLYYIFTFIDKITIYKIQSPTELSDEHF